MEANQYQYDPNAQGYYNEQAGYDQTNTQWFSDPNAAYSQSMMTGSVAPVVASSMAATRPITSVGFEYPPPTQEGLGGPLGGASGSGKPVYGQNSSRFGLSTYEGEPPLLVELGIDFSAIAEKTKSAMHPMKEIDHSLMADGDLAGPFVFTFALGFLLMLTGKLHFGYIFGFGVVGCIAMYLVLNLMTQKDTGIDLHVVVSVFGYSLLPILFVAAVAVILPLKGPLGWVLVPPSIAWCTLTATRFFEATLSAKEQRYLIAYPAFLFFACFALITVF